MAGSLLKREHYVEGSPAGVVSTEETAPDIWASVRPNIRQAAAPPRRLTLPDGTGVEVGVAAASPADGAPGSGVYVPADVARYGALFMVVEGAPFETAAFIHQAVQHALDRDRGTAAARLLRAVREACTRLQAQTLHRYELSSLGFTALLLDGTSAHVTQLPPCQAYVVDGDGVRAVPEEPMRGAAHVGSVAGRRWEVEIDLCRINLRPGTTLALCTSTSASRVGRAQLQAVGRSPVSQAAASLAGEPDRRSRRAPREALVVRLSAASATRGRLLAIETQGTARRTQSSLGLAPLSAHRGPPIEAWGLRRREGSSLPILGALAGRLQDPPDVISPGKSYRPLVATLLLVTLLLAGLAWWWKDAPAASPRITPEEASASPAGAALQVPDQAALAGRTVLLAEDLGAPRFISFTVASGVAYVLDADGRIIAAPSASSAGQPASVLSPADDLLVDVTARGADLLALERNGNVRLLDPSGGVMRTVPVAGADQWQRPVAIAVYATNLYVLDVGASGQIWRHGGDADGGFSANSQPWLQDAPPNALSDATGFAIDGDIWLAKADGSVAKLTNGRPAPLEITGLEAPIQVAGALYTQRDFRSIYVLDSAARRVVRFAKDGRYEGQVVEVFPAGEHPRSLWVDEPTGRALILTNQRLQEVTF